MCNKRCMSQREANELINSVKKRQHIKHDKNIPKRAYFCKSCGAYHTTKLATWKDDFEEKEYD